MKQNQTLPGSAPHEPRVIGRPLVAKRQHTGCCFLVELTNKGNPDRGQNPHKPLPMSRCYEQPVNDLWQAQQKVSEYIRTYQLGGANWTGGRVLDATTKREVAYISYNGRIWLPAIPKQERKPYPPVVMMTSRNSLVVTYSFIRKEIQITDLGRKGGEWVFVNPVNEDQGILVKLEKQESQFLYQFYEVTYQGIERWKPVHKQPLYSGELQQGKTQPHKTE